MDGFTVESRLVQARGLKHYSGHVYGVTLVLTLASGDTRRYESICPSGDPQAPLYAGRPEKLEQQAEAKAVSVLEQCGFGDRGSSLRRAVGQLPRASSLNELLAELRPM